MNRRNSCFGPVDAIYVFGHGPGKFGAPASAAKEKIVGLKNLPGFEDAPFAPESPRRNLSAADAERMEKKGA